MSSQEKAQLNFITYVENCHMLVNFRDLTRSMTQLPFAYSKLRYSGYSTCEQIMIALESGKCIEFKLFLEYEYRMCVQCTRLSKSIFCVPY